MNSLQALLRRGLKGRRDIEAWPIIAGKYKVVDPTAPVVVVLAEAEPLAEDLAQLAARGLCMVSPYCRNATDAEKLVKNIAANLAVQYLVFAGENGDKQPTIRALFATLSGRDPEGKELTSVGAAIRAKLGDFDLAALTKQIKPIDMLGCTDVDRIIAKVSELAADASRPNTGFRVPGRDGAPEVERVIAAKQITYEPKLDKAGAYVIRLERARIIIEHYNSKRELLRIIEGATARDLCITLIRNGWVSKLDHAAYLGRELTRAEWALQAGLPYAQDADLQLISAPPEEETQH
jgi:tetrahydromethanopterin S-methyltransferase subunit A